MKNKFIVGAAIILAFVSLIFCRCATGTSTYAYVTDGDGRLLFHNITFRNEGIMPFHLNVHNQLPRASSVTITFDPTVLELPNTRNSENHTLFPESMIQFTNEGILTLAAGATQSSAIEMILTSDGSLDPDMSYVIPLRIRVTSGNLQITERDETKLVFVRDLTAQPYQTVNPYGIRMISCYEANDMNPLNHLSFTLESTGELFFNMVIIFSANVNFDEETQRPFVRFNENLQPKFNRFYHYYRPLQERDARLILSLLPHWDRAGLANMPAEMARVFAQEVREISDTFGLDGIMLDEEYMARHYVTNPAPGFLYPSQYNLARLAFEIKQAQPHRYLLLYMFADVNASPDWEGNRFNFRLPYIDGVPPGEFIDYALHDYGRFQDLDDNQIPGLPQSRWGMRSQEWAINRYPATSQEIENLLREERDAGRLTHMIFAFDPFRRNWDSIQWPAMQRTARAYFNDVVIDSGERFPIDWR